MSEDISLIGKCGLFCGECRQFRKKKCPGCADNIKASWCKVRECCTGAQRGSCAECTEFISPQDCKKFNNVISKIFGLLFRSDRAACIQQIREKGMDGHARAMRENHSQTIRKK